MKNMPKKILKLAFICILLVLSSCEAEKDFIDKATNQQKHELRKISFAELKSNQKAFQKLKEARLKKNPNLQYREVYNENYGVFIDTTNIIVIQRGEKHSITFQIMNDEFSDKIENLVLNSKENGEYLAYITKYLLTEQEVQILKEGEIINDKYPSTITKIENNATVNVSESNSGCVDSYYLTTKYCEDSNGNVMLDNGDVGNGCQGGYFEVTSLIIDIDLGCGNNPGSGYSGTGSPGSGDSGGGSTGTGSTGTNPNNGNTENPSDNGDPLFSTTPVLDINAFKGFMLGLSQEQRDWLNQEENSEIKLSFESYINQQPNKEVAFQFSLQILMQMIVNPELFTFEQATTINIVENLSNEISGDPVELYLLLKYKHSSLLNASAFSSASNSISVGSYTLTPHYKTNGDLVYYTAVRYSSTTGSPINSIEYIIKPSGLSNFQDKIELYTAAANLFYMNGIPSQGQIALAAGDYVTGLKDMWADALTDPQYYVYLAHIFVGCATNLNAVNSTSTTFEGKIKFTSSTQGSSVQNITINNRSATQYKQLISNKFPNSTWQTHPSTSVDAILISGNIKYVGRFENNSGFYYVIDYYRNGVMIGKFRFNY